MLLTFHLIAHSYNYKIDTTHVVGCCSDIAVFWFFTHIRHFDSISVPDV